jgi:hypothetical protein
MHRDYFEDQEAESRVVRRFSSSVVKLNVATMRFEVGLSLLICSLLLPCERQLIRGGGTFSQEVLEEERVQADLEEWILKLEEIKRDIEARERLYSEFIREKKNWNHAQQKVTLPPLDHRSVG